MLLVAVLAATGLLMLYGGLTAPDGARRVASRKSLGADTVRIAGVASGWALGTAIVVAGLTGVIAVAAAAAGAAGFFSLSWIRTRRTREAASLREEWPDLLATLISSMRAGMSLAEACAELASQAGPRARPGFQAFVATYRATGSLDAGLERLREVLADPVADRVVLALQAAHEVGGSDLVGILQALAEFLHQDLRARKEIEARWSGNVTAARVAVAAPPVVLMLMTLRPEGAAAFQTPAGMLVILVGASITAVGYAVMLAIARLPGEERLR